MTTRLDEIEFIQWKNPDVSSILWNRALGI